MKRSAITILVAAALIAADVQPRDVGGDRPSALEGSWRLVYGMQDGREWPRDELRRVQMVIRGDQFEIEHGGGLAAGRIGRLQLDDATDPKLVDSTTTEGGVTLVSLGICEFSGERYKVCYAVPGQPRPTDFSCAPGSGRRLQVWRRTAPRE